MSIHVAVRVSYPEMGDYNWYAALATYVEVGAVEVAFYRPEPFLERVEPARVTAPFATPSSGSGQALPLQATTVHMAHARITELDSFHAVLDKTIAIAQALDCRHIVVHPSNARLEQVESWIAAEVDPRLEAAGLTICWETFAGQRRFLTGIEDIAAFCQGKAHHRACYDTSHLHKSQAELLADVGQYASIIGCYHLSNRSQRLGQQHLPLRHREGDIGFEELLVAIARSGFQGPITLEYLPAYHHDLVADALWAQSLLSGIYSGVNPCEGSRADSGPEVCSASPESVYRRGYS